MHCPADNSGRITSPLDHNPAGGVSMY